MKYLIKSLMLAGAISGLIGLQTAYSQDSIKMGFLGGFTGPIETLTPPIFQGAQIALDHVNANGGVLNGMSIESVSADTTCVDATEAANAADRLVNSQGVVAIVGALCSGATISAANNVAVPGGVVMVSPASTSPAIAELEDNDLVFRTAPSDSYQGQSLAKLLINKNIDMIAITYINNDYGKGFSDALSTAFAKLGGQVAANDAHEEGKADYRAEIGSLASSGAQHLVVLGYADGGGQTIVRQAVESGDFTDFIGGDGMISDSFIDAVGADAVEGMILTKSGTPEGTGLDMFIAERESAGIMEDSVYMPQAYDAAFMLALAIQKNGSGMREGMSMALREIANPPGEMIYPGQWDKALEILSSGGDVNYEGASGSHDFDEQGEVRGIIIEATVRDGELVDIGEIM